MQQISWKKHAEFVNRGRKTGKNCCLSENIWNIIIISVFIFHWDEISMQQLSTCHEKTPIIMTVSCTIFVAMSKFRHFSSQSIEYRRLLKNGGANPSCPTFGKVMCEILGLISLREMPNYATQRRYDGPCGYLFYTLPQTFGSYGTNKTTTTRQLYVSLWRSLS